MEGLRNVQFVAPKGSPRLIGLLSADRLFAGLLESRPSKNMSEKFLSHRRLASASEGSGRFTAVIARLPGGGEDDDTLLGKMLPVEFVKFLKVRSLALRGSFSWASFKPTAGTCRSSLESMQWTSVVSAARSSMDGAVVDLSRFRATPKMVDDSSCRFREFASMSLRDAWNSCPLRMNGISDLVSAQLKLELVAQYSRGIASSLCARTTCTGSESLSN
mmetsp:Transcript_41797/g.115181  ORF Transcript_41797/g.115181 Transcript_41797/m.115181 type:complete len:218 (-) Transcript_41797:540-1193(-)